jgi:hypothetical protein
MTQASLANLRAQQAASDSWTSKLNRNQHIRPQYRPMATLVTKHWSGGRPRNERGRLSVNREIMAEQLGISVNAVSRQLDGLQKCGAIRKHIRSEYDEDTGLRRDHIEIEVCDVLLERPDEIVMTGWGGKRARFCQACGSEDLVERRTIICRTCSTIQSTTEHEVNAHHDDAGDEEYDDASAQNSCPATHLDTLENAMMDDPFAEVHPETTSQHPSVQTGNKSGLWEVDSHERPHADARADAGDDWWCDDGHAHRWLPYERGTEQCRACNRIRERVGLEWVMVAGGVA